MGVVGTGALGRHHVRIAAELPEAELIGVVDRRVDVARELIAAHGGRVFPNVIALASEVDAAVVAVPTRDHLEIARTLLEAGVHVMVEKPIATTLAEADEMIDTAGDRVLAVGHVEFYNPAVQALLPVASDPGFVEFERLAAFTPRSLDVDVVLDLMIHDLQILHALDPSPVREVRATGIRVLTERVDIANVRLELESGCVANLTASRVSAEKSRKLRVFLERRYFSLDYHEQSIHGFELVAEGGERGIRPVERPVEPAEPLKAEMRAFLAACRGDEATYVSGRDGRRALETAERVLAAIDRRAG